MEKGLMHAGMEMTSYGKTGNCINTPSHDDVNSLLSCLKTLGRYSLLFGDRKPDDTW